MGFFKENAEKLGIKIFWVESEIHAAVVERFNRTIREKLSKYMQHKGSTKILKVLPQIIHNYNNSVHRSIRMKPSNVTKENAHDAWTNLYGKDELKTTTPP